MTKTKRCPQCGETLDSSFFYGNISRRDGLSNWCKKCISKHNRTAEGRKRGRDRARKWTHKTGKCDPMNKNKSCSSFLGVFVAEQVLMKSFDKITRMPYGNSGFDFICGRGYKVDVKSATRRKNRPIEWDFCIRQNKIADYFLCLAFDNRNDLNPVHVWMIPGNVINNYVTMSISESRLDKWLQWERPIDKVVTCCNKMKAKV